MTEWRAIEDFPGYEVSDDGQVRSLDRYIRVRGSNGGRRRVRGAVLTPQINEHGYRRVDLKIDGTRTPKLVHHLVLEAFVGPRPTGHETRHLDGQPPENGSGNLAWGTHTENIRDTLRHGTHGQASRLTCRFGGHLLASPNLCQSYFERTGYRICLACKRARNRADYARSHGLAAADLRALADACFAEIMKDAGPSTISAQRQLEAAAAEGDPGDEGAGA